ncbi:MAG: LysR family transcriptional regulator [Paracoccaceae bacterium]
MRFELRDLQLFAALARHEHFTRAAVACGISQPALSLRIANLEAALGMALVRRGTRFAGFTEEGEVLLRWARRILAEHEAMLAELKGERGEITGHVTLGVIPTALSFAARLAASVRAAYPRVVPVVRSASAAEIASGLAAGRFDIGISYTDDTLAGDSEAVAGGAMAGGAMLGDAGAARRAPRFLYSEGYVLLAPPALAPDAQTRLPWAAAASVPLALLTRDMKNRRIIDDAFGAAGVACRPVFETNDLATLYAFLASGQAATIAPANAAPPAAGPGTSGGFVRLDLVEPELARSVAAFLPDAAFEPPAVAAVLRLAERVAAE